MEHEKRLEHRYPIALMQVTFQRIDDEFVDIVVLRFARIEVAEAGGDEPEHVLFIGCLELMARDFCDGTRHFIATDAGKSNGELFLKVAAYFLGIIACCSRGHFLRSEFILLFFAVSKSFKPPNLS